VSTYLPNLKPLRSIFTDYAAMKGDAKGRKWGGWVELSVWQVHTSTQLDTKSGSHWK